MLFQLNHARCTKLQLLLAITTSEYQVYLNIFLYWRHHLSIQGSNRDFLCIYIRWAPRDVLKPEPEMLMYQKSMFDRYYCIKHIFARKLWRNCFKIFFLPVPIMARKSTLPANVLKMPLPGQRLTSSLLCTLLMVMSVFMTAPEWLFAKPQSRALTACDLCWLKHGC